jgi:hypothetical protein
MYKGFGQLEFVRLKLLNEEGLWQDVLKKKEIFKKTNVCPKVVKQPGNSHFWAKLMDFKDLFLEKGRIKVNRGNLTRFWKDLWIGKEPSKLKYPSLYRTVRRKGVIVANVLSTSP